MSTGTASGAAKVAGVAVDTRHWIGGQRVPSAGGPAEVDAAVGAAAAAFPGWAATSPADRASLLHAIADGIERRAEDLAQVETADNGALLRSHRRGVMPRAARNFRFFADWLGELDAGDLEFSGHHQQVSWAPSG